MLPIAVALAVASARISRNRLVLSTVLVGLLAIFAVVGTRDAFVAHEAAFEFAQESVASGIDPLAFDGGAAWSANQFGVFEESLAPIEERPGPFWVKFYAVNTDPSFGIALERLPGYEILDRVEYESLLLREPTYLYLIHRDASDGYFMRTSDF